MAVPLRLVFRDRPGSHKCARGCGFRVVTPIRTGRWHITVTEEGPTLRPSVGNGSFPCRSHYYITRGQVDWLGEYTDEMIARAREGDNPRAHPKASTAHIPWWRTALRALKHALGWPN